MHGADDRERRRLGDTSALLPPPQPLADRPRHPCVDDLLCNRSYWCYLVGAMCVYGSVVPFWFIGAKVLQRRFHIGLRAADAMILLPEGSILVVGPAIGVVSDWLKLSMRALLLVAAAALALIPLTLLVLAWTPLPKALVLPTMVLFGAGYAAAQNLVWTALPLVLPPRTIMLGAGLMASAINMLPSALPVAFRGHPAFDLTLLAAVGGVGVVAFALGACCARNPRSLP